MHDMSARIMHLASVHPIALPEIFTCRRLLP
jgi:hypothetical protein